MIIIAHYGPRSCVKDARSLEYALRQSVDTHYRREAALTVLFANLIPGLSRTSRTSLAEGAQLLSTCPTREVFRVLAPERSGSGRILDAGAATMR